MTGEGQLELLQTYEPETMAHGAFAIAHSNTGTVFIENACPGDKVVAEIYDQRKGFAYAELKDLISASDLRNPEPKCKIHKICGGCQWQHIDYQEQLHFKKQNILDLLRKAGIKTLVPNHILVKDVLGMENPWFYRNRITYPVETKANARVLAGYYKRNSHELINVKFCPIQYEEFDEIIELTKELCTKARIGKPLLRHIALRANQDRNEMLMCLVIRRSAINDYESFRLKLADLFTKVRELYPEIKGFVVNYNDLSTNVIFSDDTETIIGDDFITDTLGELKFRISATSFFQVNSTQFEKILEQIKAHISDFVEENSAQIKILDAYCGAGSIALNIAKSFENTSITGIEVIDSSIRNAKDNAQLNDITGVDFQQGRVEEFIDNYEQGHFDLIITNPPRKGCSKKVLEAFGKIQASKIIYVSCNPATLARDIKTLEDYGYGLRTLQPVDLFPHTFHIESVALLER